jgi:hypothetical protein
MIIAIIMIIVILLCVFASVVILTPEEDDNGIRGRRIEIDDLLDPGLVPRKFNGSWISGENMHMV